MKRHKHSSKFKTKVVLDALSGRYTLQELSRKHEVHSSQITKWKAHFLSQASTVFETTAEKKDQEDSTEKADLYKIIGQQKVEIDFLKKASS
jgi:transposase